MRIKLEQSIQELGNWVENHNYKGYEWYDGLSSFLRPLAFNNLFAERILLQSVRRSPVNIRPILGIKPQESTKGRGYMGAGYLNMLKITGKQEYIERAVLCLDWLMVNKSPKYADYCWGNHFDFVSRGGRYSKHEPIIVWTSLIGQTFLDAYETLGNEKYMEVAESICRWILALPREKTESGTCLSYFAFKQSSIHNSNMLGAAMLTRTASFTGNTEYLRVAKEAMEYSCSRQLPNGAWYYGEEEHYRWIDNFHTGYNLDSLKCYIKNSQDKTFEDVLQQGLKFFKSHFIEENGRPKYYHNKTYPVDIQCAAQSIDTLANLSNQDASLLVLACKVAQWTIENMQASDGHFYYRVSHLMNIKIPMIHWGQATMYKALTNLLSKTTRDVVS